MGDGIDRGGGGRYMKNWVSRDEIEQGSSNDDIRTGGAIFSS